jgi:hypothetical protein
MMAGFGLWGSALFTLYAVHALGCAFAWSAGPLRLGLIGVLLAHLAGIGWIWHEFSDGPDSAAGITARFLHGVVVWTVVSAFVATALILGPPLFLSTCT